MEHRLKAEQAAKAQKALEQKLAHAESRILGFDLAQAEQRIARLEVELVALR